MLKYVKTKLLHLVFVIRGRAAITSSTTPFYVKISELRLTFVFSFNNMINSTLFHSPQI